MHPKQSNITAVSQFFRKGFTLIETVIGIVVLAISFSVLITLIYPMTEQSADQLHQIKAAELGQSILNEIQNKAFDENSDKTGGLVRCGENSTSCTESDELGCESEEKDEFGVCDRSLFDDVDDYNMNEDNGGGNFLNYFGYELNDPTKLSELAKLYLGYNVFIKVCNDSNYDGTCDATTNIAKLITVTVKTPTGFDIVFSTYRANF